MNMAFFFPEPKATGREGNVPRVSSSKDKGGEEYESFLLWLRLSVKIARLLNVLMTIKTRRLCAEKVGFVLENPGWWRFPRYQARQSLE